MPAKLDAVMGFAIMDARLKKEKEDNQMTEADFYTAKDQKDELHRLQIRHNMEIDNEHFNSDQQLFKSFLASNPQAFLTFKKGASINRTLVNTHLKEKVKTGMQLRTERIIRMFDLHQKNLKTL